MAKSTKTRRERILELLSHNEAITVTELSDTLGVSGMTIRRDLAALADVGSVERVRGGARLPTLKTGARHATFSAGGADQPDVLILNPMETRMARMIVQDANRMGIPVLAESAPTEGCVSLIAIDSLRAGIALGRWVGEYVRDRLDGAARVLFLGVSPDVDTADRERGFFQGLSEVVPSPDFMLAVNAQGLRAESLELASAVLAAYSDINVIVGHNDQSTMGAIDALDSLRLPTDKVLLATFGLEGREGRRVLMARCPNLVGVAMFPEVVGHICADVAVKTFKGLPLPERVVTPTTILTGESLLDYYRVEDEGWSVRWDAVMDIPDELWSREAALLKPGIDLKRPSRVDFVRYLHDEYYEELLSGLRNRARELDIEVRVRDASVDLASRMDAARRSVARMGSGLVSSGESVILDAGETTTYLAGELALRIDEEFTVITNSFAVAEMLRHAKHVTLVVLGGILHRPSMALLSGAGASSVDGIHADKVFLGVKGVSLDGGLSCAYISEADYKRRIIGAAREAIVLADSSKIGEISLAQIGPVSIVDRLVTDGWIGLDDRLALVRAGIDVLVAENQQLA